MSEFEAWNSSSPSDAEEITEIGEIEEDLPVTRQKAGFGPAHPHFALLGQDLCSRHACLTAPDREPLIPKMADIECQESSLNLLNELAPRNAAEGMLATLAVAVFNASLGAVADGSREHTPPHIRDLNLRHGFKGASIAANLITTYQDRRSGGRKSVNVGKVNVEAGGQAIVGHVETRRKRTKHRDDEPVRREQKSSGRGIVEMSGTHQRKTGPMLGSPRCGARTRSGLPCCSPAVSGKKRCRMHGGAKGSGAPSDNQNALKHGAYTKHALQRRAELRVLIREAGKLLKELG